MKKTVIVFCILALVHTGCRASQLGSNGESEELQAANRVLQSDTWLSRIGSIAIDLTRRREGDNLKQYKSGIAVYSQHHYGDRHANFLLEEVRGIVLHYTVTDRFPWSLVSSSKEADEVPGVACHFVVDGTNVYQLLPLDTKGRCTFGANHNTISIEIVAMSAQDLNNKRPSMETAALLAAELLALYGVDTQALYSHEYIDSNINCNIPWIFDQTLGRCPANEKIDPGVQNMTIMRLRASSHLETIASRTRNPPQNRRPIRPGGRG